MTVNELRVGNYYRSVKFGSPVKCDLADMYELYLKSHGAYSDPPIEEMFEPIVIDQTWAKRFGFGIRNYKRPAWLSQLSAYNIAVATEKKTLEFSKGSSVEVAMQIKYVHEYQNLYFATTGKEIKV